MEFKFQRKRLNSIREEKILEELEKAAKHFNYVEFSPQKFSKIADVGVTTVKKYFGGWRKALDVLKKRLREKGLDLVPRPFAPNRVYSDKELFDEMERIWQKIGQRPSRTEWEMSDPKIAYQTYKQRFKGWTNACLKFIEYKVGGNILADDFVLPDRREEKTKQDRGIEYKQENSRNISLSVRLQVLSKDSFRCVLW